MSPWWAHYFISILTFLLTILFVSSILRAKRPAGSTLGWLIAICIIPYVGIPFYLFFSTRKFKTRLAEKRNVYTISPKLENPRELSPTQKILQASGVPPAKTNKLVELLPTGVDAYNNLLKLINSAEKTIHITTFIFGNDPVGRAVVEALTKKAALGVNVRILVDSLGAAIIRHPSFSNFKKAGGRLAYFMPVFHIPLRGRTNLRNHRKLLVVDNKFAIVGGMNLAQEYLGPTEDPKRWIDLGVKIEGDSVNDVENIFLQDWAYATREDSDATNTQASNGGNEFLSQVVASGPDVAGDPIYDVLLSGIYEAKTCVRIVTPYFIPDESLAKALEIAAKRGVFIHIIIPRKSNHRLADLARGSFVRQLETAGAKIELHPKMIHAKAVLIDQKFAVLGSANFDMRSLLLNYELGLIIYAQDVLKSVENWIFEKQRETSGSLGRSGYWRDLAEGIGRVIGPII